MNDKERLVAEIFPLGDGERFARTAAAAVRRRRATRQFGLAGGLAFAAFAAVFVNRQPVRDPQPDVRSASVAPALTIISDEELVAELQGQPVLFLKEQDRITGVVFLADGKPATWH